MTPSSTTPLARLGSYILMTAAYNEELHIEKTIASVLRQTIRPQQWLIVSDGSTDHTDDIIKSYAHRFGFIRFLTVTRAPGHSFPSKVTALQAGMPLLRDAAYDFIGNLDADITIDPDYFEQLLRRFETAPQLGLLSGFIYEDTRSEFHNRSSNRIDSVPHAAQLMRRECYAAMGGYHVLRYGGEDWYAQTYLRMNGWSAEALPELKVYHHRPTGSGTNLLNHRFRLGRLDYSFGSDPFFELLKCLQRISEPPVVSGTFARLAGFLWCFLRREPRAVSENFVNFLRKEQAQKLVMLLSGNRKARTGHVGSHAAARTPR